MNSAAERPLRGIRPGALYRALRRLTQLAGLLALLGAPLLGGWQRLDRSEMANWDAGGYDLPTALRARLPLGDTPAQVHEKNYLKGGGSAADLFGIPFMDPAAGALGLLSSSFDLRAALALGLPIVFGLFAGRVFCGFFCPFGTLARWLDAALDLVPFRYRIALPRRRPARYAVLTLTVALGIFGSYTWLYLSLPYLLLQHAAYAGWLLGGGGAVLGLVVGLLLAGLLFGPTTYCATLCPTGGLLALLGRARRVHVTLQRPKDCGSKCSLCSRSCWLQLDPSSGDPGPDCDACGRCFPICPQTNMVMTLQKPRRKLPVVAALALLGWAAPVQHTHAREQAERKPELVLDVEQTLGDTLVAVSVVDLTGVKLGAHSAYPVRTEVSVFLARGSVAEPDRDGILPSRPFYQGPLALEVHLREGGGQRAELGAPNTPTSTQKRSIYRGVFALRLRPGDRVVLPPIEGWLPDGAEWTVPHRGTSLGILAWLAYVAAGFLIFGGLLSAGLALGRERRGRARALPPT